MTELMNAVRAQADATDGNQEALRDMWGAVPGTSSQLE